MPLQLEGVGKRYGEVVALAPIDMKIDGEICGLLGNNGAGKSTLMKMIAGLLPPDSGKITLNGIPVRKEPESAKRLIGFLPESPALYPRLTAEELLTFVAEIKGVSDPSKEARRWIETFFLSEKRGALLRDLSFGMRKKVALSAAFLGAPPFLILDEPFNGLDVETMERLAGIIADAHRAGAAVLLSTHLMEYVDRLCHRALILKKGEVVREGSPALLKKEARAESFHQAFLYFTKERT
ncbi:MAG TPA: ABC transporter ATP-binding protein [Candidatus Manganitrophaceae bacterium]|nr:ABC transporter ATP-binding protein [Candidatus Manganitrophaceae bacterium]